MPFLLRTLRKNKFVEELQPEWVPQGDLQADVLKDLQTSSNKLSVWQIDDECTNLSRVLAAVAATKNFLANIDYALVDIDVIAELGLTMSETPGEVPDEVASESHRDLVQLSAEKVTELARAISDRATLERHSKTQVRKTLIHSIDAGYIDESSLKENLAHKLR